MPNFATNDRNRVRRLPARASYDAESIYPIIDEALICHVGFVADGQPFVIPTIHARMGDTIVLHGAKASRLLKHAATGEPLCITCPIVDGLVLARSVFHHSMNYRSAVIFGRGRLAESYAEKWAALEAITEHVMPGRWADARLPNELEMNATSVVLVAIEEATAKVRTGPPGDEEEDYALPIWAGVLPSQIVYGAAVNDPRLGKGIGVPGYLGEYWRNDL
jgi:nitroimidazol reductase NimA-like FMN-containing flavoprotein (pyridoxamine 5'-phosphate oxidase superfamily)